MSIQKRPKNAVLKYAEKYYNADISVSEIAKLTNTSEYLVRYYLYTIQSPNQESRRKNSKTQKQLQNLRGYIELYFLNKINIEKICIESGYSRHIVKKCIETMRINDLKGCNENNKYIPKHSNNQNNAIYKKPKKIIYTQKKNQKSQDDFYNEMSIKYGDDIIDDFKIANKKMGYS